MVRFLTLVAVCVAAAVCVRAAKSATGQAAPTIGVFMDFEAIPTATAMDAMKKEVNHIMKPMGLNVNWRWLKDNHGTETFASLVVVRFKGKCRLDPWPAEQPPFGGGVVTLGSTLVARDGRVLPYSEVECDQVTRTVPPFSPATCELERQSALGRAMARVIAHELYHVLAHTTGHAMHGLAKASQSFHAMAGGSLGFQQSDGAAMRNGLLPLR